jgi:hypothetical protein
MKKLGLILVIIALFANIGCDSLPEDEISADVEVELKNSDSEPVHMWITGYQISPENQLRQYESIKYYFRKSPEMIQGNGGEMTMTVYAGRNGSILTTKSEIIRENDHSYEFSYSDGEIVKVREL